MLVEQPAGATALCAGLDPAELGRGKARAADAPAEGPRRRRDALELALHSIKSMGTNRSSQMSGK